MYRKNFTLLSLLGVSMIALSGCSIAQGYNASEQEIVTNLTPSKYQPAAREMRDNIKTQDNFAQAAFWSREYQLNPADLEAAIKLSSSVRRMGNAPKAVEIAQTTRALHPNDPYLAAEHAAALIASDRGSEAMEPLDSALRTAPGYARLWSLKGAALDQMENYDLARRHYARALQITPNDPNIMTNMGLSFALAGDPVQAEAWLRQAASQPGAGENTRQTLDMILQLQGKEPQYSRSRSSAPTAPMNHMDFESAPTPQTYNPRNANTPNMNNGSMYAPRTQGYSGQTQTSMQQQTHQTRQQARQGNNPPNGFYQPQGYQNQTYQGRAPQNQMGRVAPQTRTPTQPSGFGQSQNKPSNYRQAPYRQSQPQIPQGQSRQVAPNRAYQPSAPQYNSQSQSSRSAPRQLTQPQAQPSQAYGQQNVGHRSNFTVMGDQNGSIKSAADAARAAARQSQNQGRRVILPAGAPEPATSVQPPNILDQIARNVGPRPTGQPAARRPMYQMQQGSAPRQAAQEYPAPERLRLPQYPYPQQQRGPSQQGNPYEAAPQQAGGYTPPQAQSNAPQQPRGAARNRR